MKLIRFQSPIIVLFFVVSLGLAALCVSASAQGTAFTYQGRLDANGSPASGLYDLRFRLFGDPLGNNQAGSAVLTNGVPVTNGLFTVTLDFGAGMFNGSNYWLEVDVKTNGAGVYANLNPLQALTPAPYAMFAGNVGSGGLAAGTYPNAVTLNNAANNFSGNGIGLISLNASQLASGTVPAAALGNAWKTVGNTGTSPTNGNFLGTTDNQPLELAVHGQRAFRLEPTTLSPNLIGGFIGNFVTNGATGAVIGGGGGALVLGSSGLNRVTDNFGVVGGGADNQAGNTNANPTDAYFATVAGGIHNVSEGVATFIGGGAENRAANNNTTISGGYQNQADGYISTIGGGWGNQIGSSAAYSTIDGGLFNSAAAYAAAIGGGYLNSVTGQYGTVPGGDQNTANTNSLAAGHRAKALHTGSFVWGDSTDQDISSTGTNQFLIRASGGVGIGTTTPQANLHVVTAGEGFRIQGPAPGGANQAWMSFVDNGGTRIGYVGDGSTADNDILLEADNGNVVLNTSAGRVLTATANGRVGIGTTSPQRALQVGDSSVASTEGMIHLGSRSASGASLRDWELGVPQTGDVTTGEGYSFVVRDTTADASARFIIQWGTGYVGIGAPVPGHLLQVGNAYCDGNTWAPSSDRNVKSGFEPVDPRAILEKVATLPISRWQYTNDSATPHLGPVAQDFHARFGLGADDKHIATVDADGVALAAIQGLNQKLEEELKRRDAENVELKQRLDTLENIVLHQKSN